MRQYQLTEGLHHLVLAFAANPQTTADWRAEVKSQGRRRESRWSEVRRKVSCSVQLWERAARQRWSSNAV